MHNRYVAYCVTLYLLSTTLQSGCSTTTRHKQVIPPNVIAAEIALGISKEEAMAFMADNGFECSIVRNGTFSDHVRLPEGGYKEIVHDDVDFVLCVHIVDGSFSRPVKTKWMIAIVLNEDDNVEKVISRKDLIGP